MLTVHHWQCMTDMQQPCRRACGTICAWQGLCSPPPAAFSGGFEQTSSSRWCLLMPGGRVVLSVGYWDNAIK